MGFNCLLLVCCLSVLGVLGELVNWARQAEMKKNWRAPADITITYYRYPKQKSKKAKAEKQKQKSKSRKAKAEMSVFATAPQTHAQTEQVLHARAQARQAAALSRDWGDWAFSEPANRDEFIWCCDVMSAWFPGAEEFAALADADTHSAKAVVDCAHHFLGICDIEVQDDAEMLERRGRAMCDADAKMQHDAEMLERRGRAMCDADAEMQHDIMRRGRIWSDAELARARTKLRNATARFLDMRRELFQTIPV
jgi:hypothetical protein